MKTHTFDVNGAARYGVHAAVVFQGIVWWCEHSKANEINYHDGLYWMFNSMKAFTELYPYFTDKQIRGAIEKLVSAGLVVKGNYNKNTFDRTLWYAVTDKGWALADGNGADDESADDNDGESICEDEKIHFPKKIKTKTQNKRTNAPLIS